LKLLDTRVDIGQLVIVLMVASDVSGNAPIIQLLGGIDKGMEDGQLADKELVEPLENGVNGL